MVRLVVVGFVMVAMSLQCSWGPKISDGSSFTTSAGNGPKITLQLERGDFWLHKAKLGFMTLKLTPQMAIWVEDSAGTVSTLMVTRAFAKQDWKFAKLGADSCGRTMCMPYWLNRLRAKGLPLPTKNNPLPDAVTAATPTGSFTLSSTLPDGFVKGQVYLEINKGFDNNSAWPAKKDYSSFNGQPPLLYVAAIDLSDSVTTNWTLELKAMSGEIGTDSLFYPVDSRITTALNMVKSITVKK